MSIPDCVIAGAGPTGLTLALELLRRGKTVRIFDRSPGPRPESQSRALGILPSTLSVLEPSGITARLLDEGLKIEHAGCFSRAMRYSVLISRKVAAAGRSSFHCRRGGLNVFFCLRSRRPVSRSSGRPKPPDKLSTATNLPSKSSATARRSRLRAGSWRAATESGPESGRRRASASPVTS